MILKCFIMLSMGFVCLDFLYGVLLFCFEAMLQVWLVSYSFSDVLSSLMIQ